ncbi:uncharacterized protein HD556DRAFT_1314332 [Suillus plorans]|uniref:Uncharacterized protein n=1 Tax=Suillus plorans TaxID=116603 RepID=A0A9P7DAR7_9AGAM|nr:uncharacterized protein HD556DRAFT_1314332 [Suillus plorans]KAG1785298.1 hypothetical protein HD556DRAFT_1314332 [Suillus plorans]
MKDKRIEEGRRDGIDMKEKRGTRGDETLGTLKVSTHIEDSTPSNNNDVIHVTSPAPIFVRPALVPPPAFTPMPPSTTPMPPSTMPMPPSSTPTPPSMTPTPPSTTPTPPSHLRRQHLRDTLTRQHQAYTLRPHQRMLAWLECTRKTPGWSLRPTFAERFVAQRSQYDVSVLVPHRARAKLIQVVSHRSQLVVSVSIPLQARAMLIQVVPCRSQCLRSHELSRRAIKLVVASYIASPVSGEVHIKIQEYNKGLTFLERADRNTLDKIIELMQFYSISAERISEFREQIPAVDLFSDEPWEVENA